MKKDLAKAVDNSEDTFACLNRYRIAVVGPCNAEGFAVVMPHPPSAVLDETLPDRGLAKGFAQFVAHTPGTCFPMETFDTPQGQGCFSHDVAVIHAIKDVKGYAELSKKL